jgi:hypothetical protein
MTSCQIRVLYVTLYSKTVTSQPFEDQPTHSSQADLSESFLKSTVLLRFLKVQKGRIMIELNIPPLIVFQTIFKTSIIVGPLGLYETAIVVHNQGANTELIT